MSSREINFVIYRRNIKMSEVSKGNSHLPIGPTFCSRQKSIRTFMLFTTSAIYNKLHQNYKETQKRIFVYRNLMHKTKTVPANISHIFLRNPNHSVIVNPNS